MTSTVTVAAQQTPSKLPKHIAFIMDGNGRWAKQRSLPRVAGHKAGLEAARQIIQACGERGIHVITLFAFSSENWRRPQQEVSYLMELFFTALDHEVKKLHKNNVRVKIIGATTNFNPDLQKRILAAQTLTQHNTGLTLVVAADYGGQWDILQAAQTLAKAACTGQLNPDDINEHTFEQHLSCSDLPHPDLLIRTSGETRISNFLLWQLAYTELYFTETLWPDFDQQALDLALADYVNRERRFGKTSGQLS